MVNHEWDAIVVVSFGGPEGPDDVVPFLQNVTRGRNIPAERLELVGQHYFARGGISPINEQNRELVAALESALAEADIDLPVYWGNRNWQPYLTDTVAQMADDGIERALAFVTSAYSSYSGCRQYRDNIAAACAAVGEHAPVIEKLRVFFNHPGFIDPLAAGLINGLASIDVEASPVILFTAHSIPSSLAATCDYEAQLRSACELVIDRSEAAAPWQLVWQSRSGPPQMPWLEPDVCDAIASLDNNVDTVVVVPVGFTSDHMEVIQDLDTDARAAAEARSLNFVRTPTCGTHPKFVDMIVALVKERLGEAQPVALGRWGVHATQCSARCCPAPAGRPARGDH